MLLKIRTVTASHNMYRDSEFELVKSHISGGVLRVTTDDILPN